MKEIFTALNNVYSGQDAFVKHIILLTLVTLYMIDLSNIWATIIISLLCVILIGVYSVTYMHKFLNNNEDASLPGLKDIRWNALYELPIIAILWSIFYLILTAFYVLLTIIPSLIIIACLGRAGILIVGLAFFTAYIFIFSLVKFALMKYAYRYDIMHAVNPFFLLNLKGAVKPYCKLLLKYIGISYVIFVIWLCAAVPILIAVLGIDALLTPDKEILNQYSNILAIPITYLYIVLWDFALPYNLKDIYNEKFRPQIDYNYF